MAAEENCNGYDGMLPCCSRWVKGISAKLPAMAVELARKTREMARDDPRRVIHSLKVGLAITLVSLFYYFKPLYDGFGASTIWAIVTVIFVFEFSVGGTLGKGLNRVMATLVAGALGFGAHYLASLCGNEGRPIMLGFSVFVIAAVTSFARFFPEMKARYDYGLLIFILTFCMVSVSGYRNEEIAKLAYDRLLTILIGCCFTVVVCIFVRPVWAGTDLHHLVAANIEALSTFLHGFGVEYFGLLQQGETGEVVDVQIYRTILNSKSNEVALANLARWEPRHGKFRHRHPWKQYLEIGNLTRECAYRLEVLNGYLKTNKTQTPLQLQGQFQEECSQICREASSGLRELAMAMRKMVPPVSAISHMEKAKIAAEKLKTHLEAWRFEELNAMEIVRVAPLTSLLVESIGCVEKTMVSVQKLASAAGFKAVEVQSSIAPEQQGLQDGCSSQAGHGAILLAHHAIMVDEETPCRYTEV